MGTEEGLAATLAELDVLEEERRQLLERLAPAARGARRLAAHQELDRIEQAIRRAETWAAVTVLPKLVLAVLVPFGLLLVELVVVSTVLRSLHALP